MDGHKLLQNLAETGIYSILGLLIMIVSFAIADRLTPYHLWQEINEKQNMALAIMVGSFFIGIALIIAAAIHG